MQNNLLATIHLLQYDEVSENDIIQVIDVINQELGLVYIPESKFALEDYTDMFWTVYNNKVFYSSPINAVQYVNPILKSDYYSKSIYENEDVVAILCECANKRKTIKFFTNSLKLSLQEFEKFIENNANSPEIESILEKKKMIRESDRKKQIYSFQLFEKKYKIVEEKSQKEEEYIFNTAKETKTAFDSIITQKLTEGFVDFYESNTCQTILEQIKELAKPTSNFIIKKAPKPVKSTQLKSHFGGDPYFEKGEKWPTNVDEEALDFIFQIINEEDLNLNLPKEIKALQLYCDPNGTLADEVDFLVKIYTSIQTEKLQKIKNNSSNNFSFIHFKDTLSFPDYRLLKVKHKALIKQIKSLFYEYDREYDALCELISGEDNVSSRLGGYPDWIQNDETPSKSELLFQLESEDELELLWGDMGAIYAFYNKENNKIASCIMQCF